MRRTLSTTPRLSSSLARRLLLVLAATVGWTTAAFSADGGLLRALEEAPLLVIGEINEVDSLAHAGQVAELVVERVLRGEEDLKLGDRVELAWEESSPKLQPRLQRQDRLVAAAGPRPTASIWKLRVSDPARRARLRTLAAEGEGYVLRPSSEGLSVLEHYLRLTQAARDGDAGSVYLARLAASTPPRLAMQALERLQAQPERAAELPPVGAQALLAALLRTDAEEVVARAIDLVEVARPKALKPLLTRQIAASGESVPIPLIAAQAALSGGLPASLFSEMSRSISEAERLAAAQWAAGPRAKAQLRGRLSTDRSPAVREAALRRLVSLEGAAASDHLVLGLGDVAPNVRRVAVESLASFGPPVLPELRRAVDRGSSDASVAAVAAISLIPGEAALGELQDLADNHSDPAVRAIAGVALQRPLGDH